MLALRPTVAGNYKLSLDADNVYEPSSFALSAVPVASILWATDAVETQPIAGGAQTFWFVGAETQVKALYQGPQGTLLFGVAPILVSSESPGPTLQGRQVQMGTAPAIVHLASAAAPQVHLLHAVDVSGIAGVGGVEVMPFFQGTGACLEPYPTEAGGARIHGPSPVRPRAAIGGTAAVVEAQKFVPQGLCLHGFEPGAGEVTITWGDASTQSMIDVL